MAVNDLFLWKQEITATLPGNPQGKITVSGAGTPRDCSIEISWLEPGESAALSYTLRMQI